MNNTLPLAVFDNLHTSTQNQGSYHLYVLALIWTLWTLLEAYLLISTLVSGGQGRPGIPGGGEKRKAEAREVEVNLQFQDCIQTVPATPRMLLRLCR